MRLKLLFAFCSIGCLRCGSAQDASPAPKKNDKTVAKPMTDKQRQKQQERLRKNWRLPTRSG